MTLRSLAGPAAALFLATGCLAVGSQETLHQVTPQRPTVSSDTNTVPGGALELESGVTWDPGDLVDTPNTLKYGLAPGTEASIGFSPLVYAELPGEDGFGISDLFLGIRHRFVDGADGRPSYAFLARTKLPTADEGEGLGTGEIDFRLALIASFGYGPIGLTSYYEAGFLGEINGDDTDLEHTLALAATGPQKGALGTFAELATIYSPERDFEAGLITTGITWSDRPDQVLDAGLVIGFGNDGPDLQFVVGMTRALGQARELSRSLRRRN